MNFKSIRFLIKWILNGLNWIKSGSDKKNKIFYPPLLFSCGRNILITKEWLKKPGISYIRCHMFIVIK